MTLHQLKLLCALAKHRNLTRAGEELFLSQPAVTLQLKELQKEVGAALYERLGKTLYLTDAGLALERYAQRILALVEEATAAVQVLQKGDGGRIRVGASNTPGIYLLPPLLSAFRRDFPAVELTVEVANTQTIEEKIRRNELDLGIVGGCIHCADLTMLPWMIDTLVLTVGMKHLWAKRRTVAPQELETQSLLGREQGSATRETYENAFLQHHFPLPRTAEMGGIEAIKRAVEAGLGVAMLSAYSVAREVKEKRLATLSLKGLHVTRSLSVVHHKDKTLTPPMRAFLKRLHESKRHGHIP
ncbi:MAG: LysR substrate-binding domain-containing protein [Candidatus Binatia bacterium]